MHAQLLAILCILAVASGRPPLGSSVQSTTKKDQAIRTNSWAEMDVEGMEAHETMSIWLEAFFKSVPETDLAPRPPLTPAPRKRSQELPKIEVFTDIEKTEDPHYWKIWRNETTCDDFIANKSTIDRKQRKYLIIAPVGSAFNASKWMTHPNHATYDIIALYYGASENFTCPLCRAVVKAAGAKWELLNRYIRKETSVWAQMYKQYDAIMVPDDDLSFHDTCTMNRIFEIFSAYDLVLGQPSVCRIDHPSTYWNLLYQNDGQFYSILRYVTFIEIMAPIFRTDFFKNVAAPSFWNAYTGWGFDFTWPFLLRYPKRHIAVIDEVCMVHNNVPGESNGEGNLYALPTPYDSHEEESRRLAEYEYHPSRVEAMGYPFKNLELLGEVKEVYCSAHDAPRAGVAGFAQANCSRPVLVDEKGEEPEEEEKESREEKVKTVSMSKNEWSWYISYVYMALIAGVGLMAVKVVGRRKDQIFVKYWPLRRGKSIKAHSSSATLT